MKKQITYAILSLTFVLGLGYLIYTLVNTSDMIANLANIIGVVILTSFTVIFTIMSFKIISKSTQLKGKVLFPITSLLLSLFIGFNLLASLGVISFPKEAALNNFTNEKITSVLSWASKNNIKIQQVYESSDTVIKDHVIRQNIEEGTLLKDVKTIEIVISSGPSYDKTVIVPTMYGWNIDDVIKFINDNHLIGVDIEYKYSSEKKDTVIDQDNSGEIRRSDKITITLSLGLESELGTSKMIDLTGKSLFDATLWLKRNGVPYDLQYEFNTKVERNYVIKQGKTVNTIVDPKSDKVTLTISKGKEIIVPDLTTMTMEDITNWIVDNNLKIDFESKFDDKISIGGIIESSVKKGDVIEEETLVHIVTSKGQLKMQKFDSLAEFRQWAQTYGVNYKEDYEYNSTIPQGGIISFSHKENDIIHNNDIVTVTVSNGKAITIPSFIGKTKSNITSTCSSLGLNCTFYYSTYSSSAKDTALSQNKTAGSQVINGTYVNIGLSKGAAKTSVVQFNESQLSIGNPDETISTLTNWVSSQYPDVTFTFVKKVSSVYENGGFIHENSPIKEGSVVTQGQSYQIWITTN